MTKSIQDKFSAETKSIGFEYQYYYFLWKLLELRPGTQVGYEVKDDIHIDTKDGTILLQAKHSVNSGNISERDKDLWKTISNWIEMIYENNSTIQLRKVYLDQTDFILVSNKSMKNEFRDTIEELKTGSKNISDINSYLDDLNKNTIASSEVKPYIASLLKIDNKTKLNFLEKIQFIMDEDDLITKCKESIYNNYIPRGKVDDVYSCIDSNLRSSNYIEIKSGNKIIITHNDFRNKFEKCFDQGRSKKLPIRKFKDSLPSNLNDQRFIKELVDIGDIFINSDRDKIISLTKEKLSLINNLRLWEMENDLLDSEIKIFKSEIISRWKVLFDKEFRPIKAKLNGGNSTAELSDQIIKSALNCLDSMKQIVFTIESDSIGIELSNGAIYYLNDENILGWHYDWKNRYSK